MDEYIKREALLNQLDERLKALRKANGPWDHYTDGYEDAADMVEYFDPAADVVEVTRCKDCTYANEYGTRCHYGVGRDTKPMGYCDSGDRRGGAK